MMPFRDFKRRKAKYLYFSYKDSKVILTILRFSWMFKNDFLNCRDQKLDFDKKRYGELACECSIIFKWCKESND